MAVNFYLLYMLVIVTVIYTSIIFLYVRALHVYLLISCYFNTTVKYIHHDIV